MDVPFEIGDKIIRISNEEVGFIHDTNKGKVIMVEVRWEATEIKQWLPAELVRPWDKASAPPTNALTGWGRTTPQHLIDIRYELSHDPVVLQQRKERWQQKKKEENLANTLFGLSNRHKTRSKKKAQTFIKKFEKGK